MDLLSITQVAEKWGLTDRRIRVLCNEGRIPDAKRVGNYWTIPADAKRPNDARIKSGKYVKQKDSIGGDKHGGD